MVVHRLQRWTENILFYKNITSSNPHFLIPRRVSDGLVCWLCSTRRTTGLYYRLTPGPCLQAGTPHTRPGCETSATKK